MQIDSGRLKILFFLLIILSVMINAVQISAYDSQSYQSCGGDNEMTIGCMGDAEIFFSGSEVQEETQSPTLTIQSPKNQTYFNGNSMKVRITTNAQNLWYNLDSGENETILPSNIAPFQADEGTHTIYVFANNSIGVTSKNVTFTINNTIFKINQEEFNGSDKGETTDFTDYSYEEVQNLDNVILEKTGKGKILFNQNINFTNDRNPHDGLADLDSNIIISYNRIEINSSALPNLNKSATLSLYDLAFLNPQILLDGSPCPDSICTEISYSGGTLQFSVTRFSVYTTQETLTPPITGQVTGGGESYDCYINSDCRKPGKEICWNHQCIARLFDIKILGFQSPVRLGDFFAFTYSLKDVANVNNDVKVDFWIEKDGKNITSGSEVIFVGGLKEIEQEGKLFIPEDIESGNYVFYIRVSNSAEIATVHRTIQIKVDNGIATIIPVPENPSLKPVIIIFSIIIFLLVTSFLIMYLRLRQKAMRNGLNAFEAIHEPYLKARSRFRIFRNRMKNNAERRRYEPSGKIVPYYTRQIASPQQAPKEEDSIRQSPSQGKYKKLREFMPRIVPETPKENENRGSALKKILEPVEVEALRLKYGITSIKPKYEAGIYKKEISKIERFPGKIFRAIKSAVGKIIKKMPGQGELKTARELIGEAKRREDYK